MWWAYWGALVSLALLAFRGWREYWRASVEATELRSRLVTLQERVAFLESELGAEQAEKDAEAEEARWHARMRSPLADE